MKSAARSFFVLSLLTAPAQAQLPGTEGLRPGDRVAIYLQDGRRLEETLTRTDAVRMLGKGLPKEQVVAVSRVPKDRLLDGVLIGSAAGAGMGLGFGYGITEGDFDAGFAAAAVVYGAAAGAGVGALLDAGMASAENPLYLRATPGQPASASRRWHLAVAPADLAGWLVGRKADMMLRDGTYLKATVRRGDEHQLEVKVHDSSEKSYRDQRNLAVEQISTVTYRENIGGNRAAATVGGALTGFFSLSLLAGSVGYDPADETRVVAGAAVGTVVGSLAGLVTAEHYNWREINLSVK